MKLTKKDKRLVIPAALVVVVTAMSAATVTGSCGGHVVLDTPGDGGPSVGGAGGLGGAGGQFPDAISAG